VDEPVRHNLLSMTTNGGLRGARRTSGLAAGSVVGGILGYVCFALVTRALGAEAAAPVAVLWVWWGFAAATITFPLQHWITRAVTAYAGERVLRVQLGRMALVVVGLALVSGLVAWLAREPVFGLDSVAFPILVVAVTLGAGVLGVVRGTLTARGRFGAVGGTLTGENVLRCLAAGGLLAAGVDDPVAYGWALVAGYLVGLVWPSSLRFGRDGEAPEAESPLALLGGVGAGQLISQLVLTGGPVLLAVAGGAPADVTALFAAMALFRAPYTLSLGLVAALTGRLTSLVVQGRWQALKRFRDAVVAGTLVAAVLGALLGGWLGPPLMSLVFGEGIRLPGGLAALLAVGTAFAMANLVLTISVVARGRSGALVRGWLLGLVPGIAVFALVDQPVVDRTCWTFLVVEAAVFGWLVVEDVLAARRSAGLAGGEEHR
jgi:O-antigen/teichoic acid export membrane protein